MRKIGLKVFSFFSNNQLKTKLRNFGERDEKIQTISFYLTFLSIYNLINEEMKPDTFALTRCQLPDHSLFKLFVGDKKKSTKGSSKICSKNFQLLTDSANSKSVKNYQTILKSSKMSLRKDNASPYCPSTIQFLSN